LSRKATADRRRFNLQVDIFVTSTVLTYVAKSTFRRRLPSTSTAPLYLLSFGRSEYALGSAFLASHACHRFYPDLHEPQRLGFYSAVEQAWR
jgi:hypothetical protein